MINQHIYKQDECENCYGCNWLVLDIDSELRGVCVCKYNILYYRKRNITDKGCMWKLRGI